MCIAGFCKANGSIPMASSNVELETSLIHKVLDKRRISLDVPTSNIGRSPKILETSLQQLLLKLEIPLVSFALLPTLVGVKTSKSNALLQLLFLEPTVHCLVKFFFSSF